MMGLSFLRRLLHRIALLAMLLPFVALSALPAGVMPGIAADGTMTLVLCTAEGAREVIVDLGTGEPVPDAPGCPWAISHLVLALASPMAVPVLALSPRRGERAVLATHLRAALAGRRHFYAGVFVAPFLIMLATIGLIMLYVSAFVGLNGERMTVTPGTAPQSVQAMADAAAAAIPGGQVVQFISPRSLSHVAVLRVKADDVATAVQVDPWTAQVVGTSPWGGGWYNLADEIHGSLMIGTTGDRMIAIAAGFGVVLIVTGLSLWWPRGAGGTFAMLVPDLAARGRALLKALHQTVGFWISALLLVFLISGMSWTGIWGSTFMQAWSTFPTEKWDAVPVSDKAHADMNHGAVKEVPWGLEQTPLPASGSDAGITGLPEGSAVTLENVAASAQSLGFVGRFQINLPADETGVWTISHDSMSNDGPNPAKDRTMHLDQYSGKLLADVGYADYSVYAQAMAWGIAFHEGDLGTWSLILNAAFCLSVLFMAGSGLVMWWMRRPAGAVRLVAPPLPVALPLWKGAVCIALVLSLAFPRVGLTLIAVLAFDLLVLPLLPGARRVLL